MDLRRRKLLDKYVLVLLLMLSCVWLKFSAVLVFSCLHLCFFKFADSGTESFEGGVNVTRMWPSNIRQCNRTFERAEWLTVLRLWAWESFLSFCPVDFLAHVLWPGLGDVILTPFSPVATGSGRACSIHRGIPFFIPPQSSLCLFLSSSLLASCPSVDQ